MDVLRRDTDYAVRAMAYLAERYGAGPVSSRQISDAENVSYKLTCKLMQKLHKAGLVESTMGKNGGFELTRQPEDISLDEIIRTVQGPVLVNRCLSRAFVCSRKGNCPVHRKLRDLQEQMDDFLQGVTLKELTREQITSEKVKTGSE